MRIDALVFTAGVGEHAPVIRENACRGLACLGAEIDPEANRQGRALISPPARPPLVWVILTDGKGVISPRAR